MSTPHRAGDEGENMDDLSKQEKNSAILSIKTDDELKVTRTPERHKMRLVIVDDGGVIHEVTDDLNEWNLSKSLGRSTLCEEIARTIKQVEQETA